MIPGLFLYFLIGFVNELEEVDGFSYPNMPPTRGADSVGASGSEHPRRLPSTHRDFAAVRCVCAHVNIATSHASTVSTHQQKHKSAPLPPTVNHPACQP